MALFDTTDLATRTLPLTYTDDQLYQALDFATAVLTQELVGYTIPDYPPLLAKMVALDVARRYLLGAERIVSETTGSESYRYAEPSSAFLTADEKRALAPLRTTRGLWTQQFTRDGNDLNTVYVPEDTAGADPIPLYVENGL